MKDRVKKAPADTSEDQLAVFNQTFASFNSTIKQLNDSYARLQSRYQRLSDELTATNEKLQESIDQNIQTRNYVQNILESLTNGVIAIDLDGKISSINKAGCDILKTSPTKVVGNDYRTVFDSSLTGKYPLVDLLTGAKPYRLIEKSIRISATVEVPVAASSSCVKDGNGHIIGALEVFEDLSEIKRMESEIARVKSLAALGEVAAVVAHEVRNPLSGIAGFAALLKGELGDNHKSVNYINKIIEGVEKLNRSVSSLLEYARDLRHEPRTSELNALLKETVEFFKVDLSSRSSQTEVQLALPKDSINCSFDRENLSGALINLLKNADQSMPKGGTITVRLENTHGVARIDVSDQGVGVPEAAREKIFTPFFTTREGGTGLGLALVRKVVDAHRGSVQVSNNRDKGSTFSIELPLR